MSPHLTNLIVDRASSENGSSIKGKQKRDDFSLPIGDVRRPPAKTPVDENQTKSDSGGGELDSPASLASPSVSFAEMLDKIEVAFNRSDSSVDVDELWRVLEDYKSEPAEWAQYAFYDERKYKRNLVAEYDKYNVMIICWAPGSQSCIHDHAGSHCFMKVLEGELFESRFAWPGQSQIQGFQSQEMCRLSDTRMKLNEVLYINDKVGLHLVGNPDLSKCAASLHVYIPPYRKCKAFDPQTGRAKQCELNFYSEAGRVISNE